MHVWGKSSGGKIIIVFEGLRAGKGQDQADRRTGKPPRVPRRGPARPTEAEGWVAIFDSSWHNRAGVEPVMVYYTAGRQIPRTSADLPRRRWSTSASC